MRSRRAAAPTLTMIGTAKKVPAGLAALVNGTMVRHLDANDIFVLQPQAALRATLVTLPRGCSRSPSSIGAAGRSY